MKKFICLVLTLIITSLPFLCSVSATKNNSAMNFKCTSAILVEAKSGTVLFEQNADEALPPASVTKIMTLLLIMEAVEAGQISLDDMVSASEHACSMGGSQIYLEVGEQMSVEDLLKSVVISSANDAAVALAEYVAGSEAVFVEMMNKKAEELGMKNTHFENTNGLDDTVENHLTSARDIAIMSAELLSHKKITEYSSIWMDTIRNGEFGLTNTNRLVRFYKGANGLKTGSTSKAGFCISASAERNGMTLIAVVMAAPTRDIRNNIATSLLDYGFANFSLYETPAEALNPVKVVGGVKSICEVKNEGFCAVVDKKSFSNVRSQVEMSEAVKAPVNIGDRVGEVKYFIGDKNIGRSYIVSTQNIECISYLHIILKFIAGMSLK